MPVKSLDPRHQFPVGPAGNQHLIVRTDGLGEHGEGTVVEFVLFQAGKLLLGQLRFIFILETRRTLVNGLNRRGGNVYSAMDLMISRRQPWRTINIKCIVVV